MSLTEASLTSSRIEIGYFEAIKCKNQEKPGMDHPLEKKEIPHC